MLRAIFIYLSKATWARHLVTRWGFAWRAASRFVAGETLDDAIRAIQVLNARGIHATLDHLGEHTTNTEEARRAADDIIQAIDAIDASGVRANVSIKLSQIGMGVDEALCQANLHRILAHAQQRANFIRIDMEDSPWVDQTLALCRQMCELGFKNTGVVIQSYLYRSAADVQQIMAMGGRIRLCKGAYKEPSEIAYPNKKDVDLNYDRLTELLVNGALACGAPALSQDGKIPPVPAIASHDPDRLTYAREYAHQQGLPKQAIEFQMLHGIRRDLQEQMVEQGYPLRVYVPYGTEWYPYFMRRLAERPANLWFFISNFFRR